MICGSCGNEFSTEKFDVCPYCLNPVKKIYVEKSVLIQESICEVNEIDEVKIMPETHEKIEIWSQEEDFEIFEEELIDKNADVQDEEVLIDEIGLSDRMVNALRRAGVHKLNDLVLFLAENSL
ncbi:hypothetical protein EII25_02990, partial [Erysipelotrichaceae bacterium OH741_COT-311]